jgi:hypothetical protein
LGEGKGDEGPDAECEGRREERISKERRHGQCWHKRSDNDGVMPAIYLLKGPPA